eukprot:6197134-Pleurochrysis_carterae.AAC.1
MSTGQSERYRFVQTVALENDERQHCANGAFKPHDDSIVASFVHRAGGKKERIESNESQPFVAVYRA